jgi:hypothetical protein
MWVVAISSFLEQLASTREGQATSVYLSVREPAARRLAPTVNVNSRTVNSSPGRAKSKQTAGGFQVVWLASARLSGWMAR